MIEYVRGRLIEKHPTFVVIEGGGIGYRLHIPVSSFAALPDIGSEAKLVTHHHVREDAEELFGFATEEERALFRLLIDVSGIGPRLAQAVLSGMPAPALREALSNGDLATLTRIPGVGRKTAERMVVELKEKVARIVPAETQPPGYAEILSADDEAVRALTSLGYNRFEARRAVERVRAQDSDLPLEEVIRAAIQAVR